MSAPEGAVATPAPAQQEQQNHQQAKHETGQKGGPENGHGQGKQGENGDQARQSETIARAITKGADNPQTLERLAEATDTQLTSQDKADLDALAGGTLPDDFLENIGANQKAEGPQEEQDETDHSSQPTSETSSAKDQAAEVTSQPGWREKFSKVFRRSSESPQTGAPANEPNAHVVTEEAKSSDSNADPNSSDVDTARSSADVTTPDQTTANGESTPLTAREATEKMEQGLDKLHKNRYEDPRWQKLFDDLYNEPSPPRQFNDSVLQGDENDRYFALRKRNKDEARAAADRAFHETYPADDETYSNNGIYDSIYGDQEAENMMHFRGRPPGDVRREDVEEFARKYPLKAARYGPILDRMRREATPQSDTATSGGESTASDDFGSGTQSTARSTETPGPLSETSPTTQIDETPTPISETSASHPPAEGADQQGQTDATDQTNAENNDKNFIDKARQKLADRKDRKAAEDKILEDRNSGKIDDSTYLDLMKQLNAGQIPEDYEPQNAQSTTEASDSQQTTNGNEQDKPGARTERDSSQPNPDTRELPVDKNELRDFFEENFRELVGLSPEDFNNKFTPELASKFNTFIKQQIQSRIQGKPDGQYVDSVGQVLDVPTVQLLKQVIHNRTGKDVDLTDLGQATFSKIAGDIGVSLPDNYREHFRPPDNEVDPYTKAENRARKENEAQTSDLTTEDFEEETSGAALPEEELQTEQRKTKEVTAEAQNKALLDIGAQLQKAGIDVNSEAGQQIADFLIKNPDQAVLINTIMTKLTEKSQSSTSPQDQLNNAADAIDEQIKNETDPEVKKRLGLLRTLIYMIGMTIVAAASGLIATAKAIDNASNNN